MLPSMPASRVVPGSLVLCVGLGLAVSARLLGDPVDATNAPPATTSDVAAAQARLRVAPGWTLTPWAVEPQVRNITSVAFDGAGRAYVVETGRRRTSVFDVRGLTPWLDDDFGFRTAGDRAAFLRRVLDPADPRYPAFLAAVNKGGRGGFQDFNRDGRIDWKDLEVESERVRRVEDVDGDGRADRAETFLDDFRSPIGGVAAGVLAEDGQVWFTSIPDLWRFDAADRRFAVPVGNDPALAAEKERHRLLTGFGVHIAFGGHDLHGLALGPDGRLYFSIADRGTCVTNLEGRVVTVPDSGAVFRCEPDGRRFEVFATGLRNPQELAFDDLGQLWTGDNNGDGGDKARWTLVLEGADHGWTLGWQWLPKMGAWNSERLWHLRDRNSAAYLVPPVAHVGHGPAGIAHYPGTGLGDAFQGHFLYADFPGGLRHFAMEPVGAFFRVKDAGPWMEDNSAANRTGKLLWDLSPVDVVFPPFGGVVVADWVQGWDKTGQGRLWHLKPPGLEKDAAVAEVRALLAGGFRGRPLAGCVEFLGHRDQRVRSAAQRECVRRGPEGVPALVEVAVRPGPRLARLHAMWGLETLRRHGAFVPDRVVERRLSGLLRDTDPEIRGQGARTLARLGGTAAERDIADLLKDPSARVRFFALEALRSLEDDGARRLSSATAWKIDRLAAGSAGMDPAEFHAWTRVVPVVEALHHLGDPAASGRTVPRSRIGHAGELARAEGADRLRLAVLLRLRRERDPEVARFLSSTNAVLRLEAARAVHDLGIDAGRDALIRLLDPGVPWASADSTTRLAEVAVRGDEAKAWTLRRAVDAAFLRGGATDAALLSRTASDDGIPESVRVEALEALGDWAEPPRRDRVTGLLRARVASPAAEAVSSLVAVWEGSSRRGLPPEVTAAVLRAAERLRVPALEGWLAQAASHPSKEVREEAARIASSAKPATLAQASGILAAGTTARRRQAVELLGTSEEPGAPGQLAEWIRRWAEGKAEPELGPDLLDAARRPERAAVPEVAEAVAAWRRSLPAGDPLAPFRPALAGGDATRGRKLFAERADWGCQRCHRLGGEGGDVGPELAGLGRRRDREHVLRSILQPNAEIAKGYENVALELADGTSVAGMLRSEKDGVLTVLAGEDREVRVPADRIRKRERAPSSMPEGLGDLMKLGELRDLVEALSR